MIISKSEKIEVSFSHYLFIWLNNESGLDNFYFSFFLNHHELETI